MKRGTFAAIVLIGLLLAPGAAAQPKSDDAPESVKGEARLLFERGVKLSEELAWDSALAEFVRSYELYPTRNASRNAAVCLRKLRRYDEALDMLEGLVSRFPNIAVDDRWSIDAEMKELRALVGTLTVAAPAGATIAIDERTRGTAPLAGVRVAAGTHRVRVYQQGFTPFETSLAIAGAQTRSVDAHLVALARSGQLSVTEAKGQAVSVVVDGIPVGKTPWTGPLAPGQHSVFLRGDGDLGTQPAVASVRLDQTAAVSLAVEALPCELRVQPNPAGASVALDGTLLGHGVWAGRVRAGAHRVEVVEDGFLAARRDVVLAPKAHESIDVALERDPTSPLWGGKRGGFVFGLRGGAALAPSLGGSVTDSCTGACTDSLAFGPRVAVRGAYELASGFSFALDVGYLRVTEHEHERPMTLAEWPDGVRTNPGVGNDDLSLQGVSLMAAAGLRRGASWFWHVGLGAGVLVGSVADSRTATISPNGAAPFAVGPYHEAPGAFYALLMPEVRTGVHLGRHVSLSLGVELIAGLALAQPSWQDRSDVVTPTIGFARFGSESLAGRTLWVVVPTFGVEYGL